MARFKFVFCVQDRTKSNIVDEPDLTSASDVHDLSQVVIEIGQLDFERTPEHLRRAMVQDLLGTAIDSVIDKILDRMKEPA
jgi:hypothetical protein